MLSFDEIVHSFDGFLGLSPESVMTVLLVVELLCAVCIMLGFLTRLAVLFPMGLMLVAETVLLPQTSVTDPMFSFLPGYPVMFIGIFVYMLLAGPGKISLDYLIAAHFTESRVEEEVLDKA